MSTTKFKTLRQYAIEMSLEWREYHLAQMESALNADHTITAQDEFNCADRAEKCATWLKSANKAQFARWFTQYKSTGSAVVSE